MAADDKEKGLMEQIAVFESKLDGSSHTCSVKILHERLQSLKERPSARRVGQISSLHKLYMVIQDEHERRESDFEIMYESDPILRYFDWYLQFLDFLKDLKIGFNNLIYTPLKTFFMDKRYVTPLPGRTASRSSTLLSISTIRLSSDPTDFRQFEYNGRDSLKDEFAELADIYENNEIAKLSSQLERVSNQWDALLDYDTELRADMFEIDLPVTSREESMHINRDVSNLVRLVPDIIMKGKRAVYVAKKWIRCYANRSEMLEEKLHKLMNLQQKMSLKLADIHNDIKKKEAQLATTSQSVDWLLKREERSEDINIQIYDTEQNIEKWQAALEQANKEKHRLATDMLDSTHFDKDTLTLQKLQYEENKLKRYILDRKLKAAHYQQSILQDDLSVEREVKPSIIRFTNDTQEKYEQLEKELDQKQRTKRMIEQALVPLQNDREMLNSQINGSEVKEDSFNRSFVSQLSSQCISASTSPVNFVSPSYSPVSAQKELEPSVSDQSEIPQHPIVEEAASIAAVEEANLSEQKQFLQIVELEDPKPEPEPEPEDPKPVSKPKPRKPKPKPVERPPWQHTYKPKTLGKQPAAKTKTEKIEEAVVRKVGNKKADTNKVKTEMTSGARPQKTKEKRKQQLANNGNVKNKVEEEDPNEIDHVVQSGKPLATEDTDTDSQSKKQNKTKQPASQQHIPKEDYPITEDRWEDVNPKEHHQKPLTQSHKHKEQHRYYQKEQLHNEGQQLNQQRNAHVQGEIYGSNQGNSQEAEQSHAAEVNQRQSFEADSYEASPKQSMVSEMRTTNDTANPRNNESLNEQVLKIQELEQERKRWQQQQNEQQQLLIKQQQQLIQQQQQILLQSQELVKPLIQKQKDEFGHPQDVEVKRTQDMGIRREQEHKQKVEPNIHFVKQDPQEQEHTSETEHPQMPSSSNGTKHTSFSQVHYPNDKDSPNDYHQQSRSHVDQEKDGYPEASETEEEPVITRRSETEVWARPPLNPPRQNVASKLRQFGKAEKEDKSPRPTAKADVRPKQITANPRQSVGTNPISPKQSAIVRSHAARDTGSPIENQNLGPVPALRRLSSLDDFSTSSTSSPKGSSESSIRYETQPKVPLHKHNQYYQPISNKTVNNVSEPKSVLKKDYVHNEQREPEYNYNEQRGPHRVRQEQKEPDNLSSLYTDKRVVSVNQVLSSKPHTVQQQPKSQPKPKLQQKPTRYSPPPQDILDECEEDQEPSYAPKPAIKVPDVIPKYKSPFLAYGQIPESDKRVKPLGNPQPGPNVQIQDDDDDNESFSISESSFSSEESAKEPKVRFNDDVDVMSDQPEDVMLKSTLHRRQGEGKANTPWYQKPNVLSK